MTAWDVDLYLRFGDVRTRAAADLAARVALADPRRVADLGCGPGNSTAILKQRWPGALVCGVDSSAEMIAAARKTGVDAEWIEARIEDWVPAEPFDLVFSNASLQWVPGHAPLVGRLFSSVAGGGALAFQIPSATYATVRTLIHEIADDPSWRARMRGARAALTMEQPSVYYDALASAARLLDIWETEYFHVMEGPEAIVEWIAGTGLRPFLDALEGEAERTRFRSMLTERVAGAYPRRADGRVLFPFRRLFVLAYR